MIVISLSWRTLSSRLMVGLLAATALSGCAATERLSQIGRAHV